METNKWLKVRGAKTHNLKDISVDIPKDQFVVFTGLSGSGKSSLAFDTIYAEGKRRYVESLSTYARQFLGQMDKAEVDQIDGLSPAIAIEQKTTNHNPRSTVGTVTEIYDYLRLLYSRVGVPYCPHDHIPIVAQSLSEITEEIMQWEEGTKIQILAPIVQKENSDLKAIVERWKKEGYLRFYIDEEMVLGDEFVGVDPKKEHSLSIVIDRLVMKKGIQTRLYESLELAGQLSDGRIEVLKNKEKEPHTYNENYACAKCGFTVEELTPTLFSFNSPYGACPQCDGLGRKLEVDLEAVIPDDGLTLEEGALAPWQPKSSNYYRDLLTAACEKFSIPMDVPFKKLKKKQRELLLYGDKKKEKIRFERRNEFTGEMRTAEVTFEGVVPNVWRRYNETSSDTVREQLKDYIQALPCPHCHGYRLNDQALSVHIGGKNIGEVTALSVEEALQFFSQLEFDSVHQQIAAPIQKEIQSRLQFLQNVGLDYLTLNRTAGSLSGGESQRIRLATQIGANLSGVLYVLDEPSIGLHQRDNDRLLSSLRAMQQLGNTLIVVEHDEDTIRAADYIVEIGPKAGKNGGEIIATGSVEDLIKEPRSITGQYLSQKKQISPREETRPLDQGEIIVRGAKENNLQNIEVHFPLHTFTAVTGVSGSGKSTLVNQILKRGLWQKMGIKTEKPGRHEEILGVEQIEKIIDIDQSPIGRTPRSNPATYTSVFDDIRELFAQTKEAKARGYQKGRFSFNVKGGRCEYCKGDGILKIEMHFLPDVYVPCEVCKGTRYNSETLEVKYRGKTIAEVLDMTVAEAVEFFAAIPKIERKLQTLMDVGLDYITLGQPATTLSGGEAQRIKLASELQKKNTGNYLYILDEPTTGLHPDDVKRLLDILQRLVDNGNTVLVIEHNLDVIQCADYIIDLGPEGGVKGGQVIATGTPKEVAQCKESYTGQYLKKLWKERNNGR